MLILDDAEQIARELKASDGFEIEAKPLYNDDKNNLHYVGFHEGKKCFIKIYRKKNSFEAEKEACRLLSGAVDVRFSKILVSGALSNGQCWAAFEWVDIIPINSPQNHIYAIAKALSTLHAVSVDAPTSLNAHKGAKEALAERIERLRTVDTVLAQRVESLTLKLVPEAVQVADAVFLHGDFGWRNIGFSEGENVMVFDFEHAAIGSRYLDFGKMWDRELKDAEIRRSFLEAYLGHAPNMTEWEMVMLPVRLWVSAGIFPYASEKNDAGFMAHGYNILNNIENFLLEMGGHVTGSVEGGIGGAWAAYDA